MSDGAAQDETPNVLGISLGSAYSAIAVLDREGRATCIANEDGDRQTPSYVAFLAEEEAFQFAGTQAKAQAVRNPANTITRFRNLLGRSFDDPVVRKAAGLSRAKLVEAADGRPAYVVQCRGEELQVTPRDAMAKLLVQLRSSAEAYTGRPVTGAVLAVPANASDAYRAELASAAREAGVTVLRVVSEPAAAALAFGGSADVRSSSPGGDRNIAVVDLGAAGFDVSVLAVRGGIYTTLAAAHDDTVGGDAIDELLVKHFASEFKRKNARDCDTLDPKASSKLRNAVEVTKKTLTLSASAACHVEALADGIDFSTNLNKLRFDMLTAKVFAKCADIVEETAKKAGLKPTEVDEVRTTLICPSLATSLLQILLVGGCSRIPKLISKLRGVFAASKIRNDVESDEAIACGCAAEAALLAVLPDAELTLTDADTLAPHLKVDTPLPVMRSVTFRKTADQTAVYIAVYEGEPPAPADSRETEGGDEDVVERKEDGKEDPCTPPHRELVAELVLDLLPQGKETSIEVIFNVDAKGLLKVTARSTDGKTVSASVAAR
ncbi:MAG: heat shock protein 70 family [Olpidium bornovanus]|uniref:Heat shock protein 70 family n=1 Tax=Olpidium bornovanus TaxID=278681 RepID=A0A8H7ZW50_9FUNG|nr:MAG: heat shock protein 70 family [Olpidium bornovanus]